jgi:hypothetical protein
MLQDYSISNEFSCFSSARDQFDSLLKELVSVDNLAADHGEVEQFVNDQGFELMRRIFQGYLKLQSEQETVVPKAELPRVRYQTPRQLSTRFGKVTVTRMSYGKPNSASQFPLDNRLNLPPDSYSDGLRQRLASQASLTSYDNAVDLVRSNCAGAIPKRQALKVMADMAQDFETYYQQRERQTDMSKDLLVLTFDGKGIVMRKEGLRECTRIKAEQAANKLETRLSAGEKKDRKRMAQVAAVYSVKANVRQPEQIMRLPSQENNVLPFRAPSCNKRVWASVERSAQQVISEAFDEALKRDPKQERQWVILVDGHKQQLAQLYRELNRRQLKATVVMDFIHVLEYLWKAAWSLHDKGDVAAEHWVAERALKLLKGECGQVVKGLRGGATKRGMSKIERKNIDLCANYLYNNRKRLAYGTALENGDPIATGVIEGTCRHLINDRLDITGARWSLEGAEAMLKIRAIRSSGDWSSYWPYYKQQSKQRLYGGWVA